MAFDCNFRVYISNFWVELDEFPGLKSCFEYIYHIFIVICIVIYWVFAILRFLLQFRVITIIFCCLSVHICWVFHYYYGIYKYQHIPIELLEAQLYKQRSPKLVLDKSKPDCKYDELLKSTNSIPIWKVVRNNDDFSANGLVNGSYAPEHCNALFSVAIIVAYKNRQKQLDIFLPHINNFLRKQNIHYRLYIVEQQDEKTFNKGILYNVGAKTAMGDKFPCLILHDVDLLPLDDSNLYACTNEPRHMSASVDKFRFILPYEELMGGVVAIKSEQFVALNGYSNRFEGWGGEDDDFYHRLTPEKLNLTRFPPEMSHFKVLSHPQEPPNENRFMIMRENWKHGFDKDGLSTLPHVSARIFNHPLFTLVGVQIPNHTQVFKHQ